MIFSFTRNVDWCQKEVQVNFPNISGDEIGPTIWTFIMALSSLVNDTGYPLPSSYLGSKMVPNHWKLPKLLVVNAAPVFTFHIMCLAIFEHLNPGPAYKSMQTEDGWEEMKKGEEKRLQNSSLVVCDLKLGEA